VRERPQRGADMRGAFVCRRGKVDATEPTKPGQAPAALPPSILPVMHLPSTAALAGVLLAGLAASTEPTQVARTVDAPAISVHESAAVHPAQPVAAGSS